MKRTVFKLFLIALTFSFFIFFGCSKSNETSATIYGEWRLTHAWGAMAFNGYILAMNENTDTEDHTDVEFELEGKYHFTIQSLADEKMGFQKTDSLITLDSDSSVFANFCAYPLVSFSTSPIPSLLPNLRIVSPDLHIEWLSNDSLQVRTVETRHGTSGAPDTVYTQHTGFRKKHG
jgi:hypothetical protein